MSFPRPKRIYAPERGSPRTGTDRKRTISGGGMASSCLSAQVARVKGRGGVAVRRKSANPPTSETAKLIQQTSGSRRGRYSERREREWGGKRVEVPVPLPHPIMAKDGVWMNCYVMFIFSPFPSPSLFIHPLPSFFFRRKRCPAFPKGGFCPQRLPTSSVAGVFSGTG